MSMTRGSLVVIGDIGKSRHTLAVLVVMAAVLKACPYPFVSVQSVALFFTIVMASVAEQYRSRDSHHALPLGRAITISETIERMKRTPTEKNSLSCLCAVSRPFRDPAQAICEL
jgi:hypothetical protein